MIDQHFTPSWLADLVAAAVPANLQGFAIDPAAGSGALLASLQRRGLETLSPLAIDIDRSVVSDLRSAYPAWTVSVADSLSPRSRASTHAWRIARSRGVEVVLLNPPFSYRGGPSTITSFRGFVGRLSPAAQFVAMSIDYLKPRYGTIAILPEGVLEGQKYRSFWDEVARTHVVRVLHRLDNSSFSGVRARCSLVEIIAREPSTVLNFDTPGDACTSPPTATRWREPAEIFHSCRCVEVIRGRVPRHRVSLASEGIHFVHTTNLQSDNAVLTADRASSGLSTSGPYVLLPRIGYPNGKIAISRQSSLVLSDCVIALRPLAAPVEELAGAVRGEIGLLRGEYVGTGAPYITLDRLVAFLATLGWLPRIVSASAGLGGCQCGQVPVRQRASITPVA